MRIAAYVRILGFITWTTVFLLLLPFVCAHGFVLTVSSELIIMFDHLFGPTSLFLRCHEGNEKTYYIDRIPWLFIIYTITSAIIHHRFPQFPLFTCQYTLLTGSFSLLFNVYYQQEHSSPSFTSEPLLAKITEKLVPKFSTFLPRLQNSVYHDMFLHD